MKLFTGWVMSAGLVLAATSANAQTVAPTEAGNARYQAASDVGGPYAAMPPEAPGNGPRLLPGPEVYTVVRENGFSPLGIPQQRGFFYTIAVMDRGGADGRLVIDARDGRIVRFVPAYRVGLNYDEGLPVNQVRGVPRPPALVPHVASRTPSVPLPRAMPPRAGEPPVAAKPDAGPASQSMAMQAKPAETKPAEVSKSPQNTAPAPIEAKPAPQIQPTQEMPKVQGLE
jgi:hypothetical protein